MSRRNGVVAFGIYSEGILVYVGDIFYLSIIGCGLLADAIDDIGENEVIVEIF
jgi:hypothetical protein